MSVQLEAPQDDTGLLKAVAALEPVEFQRFVNGVLTLRAQRTAPCLSSGESELLQQINSGLPTRLLSSYEALRQKRDQQTLTAEEHSELLSISNEIEMREAERVAALAALAEMRGVPLSRLIHDLGIQAPEHG